MPYLDSLDIANRSCQHIGCQRIASINEDSLQNTEISAAYDKIRTAELRRNVWRFATRRSILRPVTPTTLLLAPRPWAVNVLYMPGAIVSDANGDLWISTQPENIGNAPIDSSVWEQYFGPLTVDAFNATTTYQAGELCYVSLGNPGAFVVFLSLMNYNADVPNVAAAWSATTTYSYDQTVSYNGSQWRSLIALNLAITPVDAPLGWDPATTYAATNTVVGSDGFIYSSNAGSNVGKDPVQTTGFWTNTTVAAAWTRNPATYANDTQWLAVYANLAPLIFIYPIGTGPTTQTQTKNIFRLPAGFLRRAPEDPKAGSTSFLGAPSGLWYDDWTLEGNYLVSMEAQPIMLRFVADISDVTQMDEMFCEGLAARIAMAVCQRVTQSGAKLAQIENEYKLFMGEARTVNGIETGPTEPPEDDYITCRW